MNPDKFTNSFKELFNRSIEIAKENLNPTLDPIHLFFASLNDDFCLSFFKLFNLDIEILKKESLIEISKLPKIEGGQLSIDYKLERLLNNINKISQELNDSYLGLEALLLAFSDSSNNFLPHSINKIFESGNFNKSTLKDHIIKFRKGKVVNNKNSENQYNILEKYCDNLTNRAKNGLLDPVIGRHEEIRRVIQILSRRTKNNPVLIGEPGVGKTAIVEGIAQRIINNDVPESLKNNTIYSLDLGLLLAGAKYQGEFEERLKGVLKEIEDSNDSIILFIDEIHMLIGAGSSSSGAMDASNLLKPALSRGLLHCIGATTLKEYKKYIEKDAALERRFQKVLVEEPSIEDSVSILRGLKEKYEIHHGIRIKDQALIDAVLLSSKHINDRFLPDKAIDLVDEAAAMVKMSIDSQPEVIDKLERKIRQLEIEKLALEKEKNEDIAKNRLDELEKELISLKENYHKLLNQWKSEKAPLENINKIKEQIELLYQQFHQAERNGDFAKASEIKYGKIVQLEKELNHEQEKLKKLNVEMIKQEVNENDIALVLSRWTGIDASKLQSSDLEKLINMKPWLQEHVIGQDEAISVITHAIQMHKTGLLDPNRPIGSFMFLGPTGVGKTEVAKMLSEYLFNDSKRMVRIDMSEYMEKHSVARLIGAPPGYIGYEEGGQLTEAIRKHPYTVVLFDEIEKAHPDVFHIFLQILDEGHLTDSQGRRVSFKNSIIIMTSNIGSSLILESPNGITDEIKMQIEILLHKHFRPEFLNRIDSVVFFNSLTEKDVIKIAYLQIHILVKRLKDKNIDLHISDDVVKKVASLGYNKEFGARPLKRTILNNISVPLSQYILKHPGLSTVSIKLDNKGDIIING